MVRLSQPEKASSPKRTTLFGMVIDVRLLQQSNANGPISVIPLGTITEIRLSIRPLNPPKANRPIFVILSGIITLLLLP